MKKNLIYPSDEDYIEYQLGKVKFSLKMCDFNQLSILTEAISDNLMNHQSYKERLENVNREFSMVFDYLSKYFRSYNDIIIGESEIDRIVILRNVDSLRYIYI